MPTLAVVQWESYKFLKRPAVWVSIGILLVLAVGLGYGLFYLLYTYSPATSNQGLPRGVKLSDFKIQLYPAAFAQYTISFWYGLGGVFALILGVLSQGSEYGWGTIKTLYTQRPGRVELLAGKIVSLLLWVLLMVVLLFAVAAAASLVVAIVDGKSTLFPPLIDIYKAIAATWLIFGFSAIFGLTLATLFRQSAMAIGIGLAYSVVIEGLIFSIAGNVGGTLVKQVESWFPFANGGYLAQSFGTSLPPALERTIAKPIADANHAVLVLLAYFVVFLVLSAYLVRARDVTN